MRKVHEFFCNMIAELNNEIPNINCPEKLGELITKLDEAWELRMIVSQSIDWDDNDEEVKEWVGEI